MADVRQKDGLRAVGLFRQLTRFFLLLGDAPQPVSMALISNPIPKRPRDRGSSATPSATVIVPSIPVRAVTRRSTPGAYDGEASGVNSFHCVANRIVGSAGATECCVAWETFARVARNHLGELRSACIGSQPPHLQNISALPDGERGTGPGHGQRSSTHAGCASARLRSARAISRAFLTSAHPAPSTEFLVCHHELSALRAPWQLR